MILNLLDDTCSMNDLYEQLLNKKITRDELVKKIIEKPEIIPTVLEGISSKKANIRYGCANPLKFVSDEKPEVLYPYMDFFIDLLDSDYRILNWIGMAVLANLASIDGNKKFDKAFDKYYSFIDNEYMVSVANVVGSSGKIALAKPYLIPRITEQLLRIEKIKTTPHLTEECKKVISEKAIESFDMFFDRVKNKEQVLSFVKKHTNSSRKSLKTKAESFINKWQN